MIDQRLQFDSSQLPRIQAEHDEGFDPKHNNVPRGLLDERRLGEITAIGTVDGGTWADILAVSYGEHDTTIRLRLEHGGERVEVPLPHGLSLEEALTDIAEGLMRLFPFSTMPSVRVYRGRQARKWVKQLIRRASMAADECIERGEASDGERRLQVRMPYV